VWQCKYVLLTAADGGIVNDPVLLRLGEDHFWLALADSDALLYVAGVAAGRGMDVTIREADVAPMQIQGPRSKDVIGSLFGDAIRDLRYYWCAEAEVDGIPVVVSRTGWTGEVGYEIYLRDTSRGDDLWEAVRQAGEPFGIRAIAPSEARRIEAGIFNYGSDMRIEDTPFHVSGLEKFVELDQAHDFMGKAALARLSETGVERKLVGIDIGGDPLTDEGALNDVWPVHAAGGERLGRVTAGAWSPRLERNVGFAWVPGSHMTAGTELELADPRGMRTATVTTLPFVDPNKDTPKA
jgi:aminomethyltransferase